MRELVFKAWCKELGMSNIFGIGSYPTWGKLKEETLPHWTQKCKFMQFTGIEYNFHEYFDDDVCLLTIPTKDGKTEIIKGIVEFMVGSFFLNEIGGKNRKWIFSEVATMSIESKHCVIYLGNIHDNPELLEDK